MSTQPEALRVADAIADRRDWYEFDASAWCPQAAALLRTQHAEIEASNRNLEQLSDELAQSRRDVARKDALLRQALRALELYKAYGWPDRNGVIPAITSELAK